MPLPELRIGNLTARIPIIQGGMGVGISKSRLASAVARAGAIGMIATVGLGLVSDYYKKPADFFPSNIKGLPTWFSIRVSDDGYLGRVAHDDIIVLPCVHGRSTNITNFSSFNDVMQGFHRFFNRRVVIPAMDNIKIDIFHAKSLQALINLAQDMFP